MPLIFEKWDQCWWCFVVFHKNCSFESWAWCLWETWIMFKYQGQSGRQSGTPSWWRSIMALHAGSEHSLVWNSVSGHAIGQQDLIPHGGAHIGGDKIFSSATFSQKAAAFIKVQYALFLFLIQQVLGSSILLSLANLICYQNQGEYMSCLKTSLNRKAWTKKSSLLMLNLHRTE